MREESGRGQFAPARPQGGAGNQRQADDGGRFPPSSSYVAFACWPGDGLGAHAVLPASEFSGYDAGRVETTG